MILTFRGFSLKISNIKIPLTFFKEVFTDTLYAERYAGSRLNCKYWTIESGLLRMSCKNWIVEIGLQ